ncbi:MAG: HlyD family efflux transporter periplasmic adaptor subunit [Bacteroidota bacterium]
MIRKIVLYVLGAVLILTSVVLARRIISSRKKPKAVVDKVIKTAFTQKVRNGLVPIVIPANGNLVAKRRLELYAEVQGIFLPRKKLYRTGEKYTKGEVLIRLDDREYYASVQSAKTNLYNLITSVMPDLRLDYPDAYNTWRKYLEGFDINKTTPTLPGFSSEQEKYFITAKDILSSYYNVKNMEEKLFKYTIAAPFSGVLSEAVVTEGTLVRTGQKLGEFIDPSVYELEVSISNRFADLLKEGKEVTLNNLDDTKKYKGTVVRINKIVDVETQTVTAFIQLSGKSLREGMFLEALLQAKEETEAFEMDRSLMVSENEIYVIKEGNLDLLKVNPVYFSDKKVVLKGIPEGTDVLLKPVPGAHPGLAVKIYEGE